jgi:uncharacterized protein involved in tolerance to divalent cations
MSAQLEQEQQLDKIEHAILEDRLANSMRMLERLHRLFLWKAPEHYDKTGLYNEVEDALCEAIDENILSANPPLRSLDSD